MASGIFLMEEGLSQDGFKHYVEPWFANNNRGHFENIHNGNRLLVSLVGGEGLDGDLNMSLLEAGKQIEEDEKTYHRFNNESTCPSWRTYSHMVASGRHVDKEGKRTWVEHGLYETLGIYKDNNGASLVFPHFAVKYAADDAMEKVTELSEHIESEIGSIMKKLL